MNISSIIQGEDVRVLVSGRIDAVESASFSAELATQIGDAAGDVTIDLSDVDYLDSSGLAVLVRSWREQSARGSGFSIALPAAASARRIFSLTGFDAVFDIVETDGVDHR